MDYEHQPTGGPGLWIGAGLLVAVGAISLIWVGASSGETTMIVLGSILVVVGVVSVVGGAWGVARNRR